MTTRASAGAAKLRRRRYSRLNSSDASTSCTNTDATERYHTQLSRKPATRESSSTGIATTKRRVADVASDGIVLPIAWNMLDVTKMIPDATKFHETMRRYSTP